MSRIRVMAMTVMLVAMVATACNVDVVGADGPWSQAMAINDHGQVVGERMGQDGKWIWFITERETGRMIDIAPTWGANNVAFWDINDSGVVVGRSYDPHQGTSAAVRWDPATGVMSSIGGVSTQGYSFAVAINDAGQIVGNSRAGGTEKAFVWDEQHGARDIGNFSGFQYALSSVPRAINDVGQVAGWSQAIGSLIPHAFFWDPSTQVMIDLGSLRGAVGTSEALAMNDNGVVVGWSETDEGVPHLVQWTVTSGGVDMVDLTARNERVVGKAVGVNNAGQIAVTFDDPAPGLQPTKAVRYTFATDTWLDLGGLGVENGGAYVNGINDAGQLSGAAASPSGNGSHAVVFTP